MNTLLIDTLIGAFVGLFAGLISQNTTSWKIFAFLWGAPLSLFIPLYKTIECMTNHLNS